MNEMSRKNAVNMESVRLWIHELRETKFYSTLFVVDHHANSPFLILESVEEWYVDSTHKASNREATVVLVQWLEWVKNRASEKHIKTDVKIANATHKSVHV
ncbi:hypothetical protein INT48_009462 [Thamnidium elegans]|uniref:Uncharacterized protein n=1 Tax=Thamnidium elegans TaxID=101142 RepID=A0A8H7SLM6_9FUNG|nr:hypothetical protein INT48_009462 [Thamnidium elegans]